MCFKFKLNILRIHHTLIATIKQINIIKLKSHRYSH